VSAQPSGKVVYYAAMSLDGFIAESDDTLEWLMEYEGSFDDPDATPMKGSYEEFYDGVGALVMGSATYEFVYEHEGAEGNWPYAGKPSWILTSRELPGYEGSKDEIHFTDGDVAELGPAMIEAAGDKQLWVVGGGNVATQFVDAGLLDTLVLTVTPVVLGKGKPLFDERLPGGPLQLTGTRTFDSGMVELSYALTSAADSPAGSRP
jgi:dihydrofolate reductase